MILDYSGMPVRLSATMHGRVPARGAKTSPRGSSGRIPKNRSAPHHGNGETPLRVQVLDLVRPAGGALVHDLAHVTEVHFHHKHPLFLKLS